MNEEFLKRVKKYRVKNSEITAVQWDGTLENAIDICSFFDDPDDPMLRCGEMPDKKVVFYICKVGYENYLNPGDYLVDHAGLYEDRCFLVYRPDDFGFLYSEKD